jgi:hypothetical protein
MSFHLAESAILQNLGTEAIIMNQTSGHYFELNASGQRVLSCLIEGGDLDESILALQHEFELTPQDARTDVLTFIEQLLDYGILVKS